MIYLGSKLLHSYEVTVYWTYFWIQFFEITSNHFNVFVKHHGDTGTIVESTEDQLLDPKCELPSYIANKIVNYIFSVAEEMAFIIEYFEWTVIQR